MAAPGKPQRSSGIWKGRLTVANIGTVAGRMQGYGTTTTTTTTTTT